MIDISRHMSLINPHDHPQRIAIIGAGATGSYVAYNLAKIGYKEIAVYDFDVVESHNLANQMYNNDNIGQRKVNALSQNLNTALMDLSNPTERRPIIEYYDEVTTNYMNDNTSTWEKYTIVFLLVDTLAARAEIYDWYEERMLSVDFIETRLAATHGEVYYFSSVHESGQKWREELPSDDEIERDVTACGSSITIGQSAMLLAGYASWAFIDHAVGEDVPYKKWFEFRQGMSEVTYL